MKSTLFYFINLISLFQLSNVIAEDMHNGTITACSGSFYDSGGSNGNYASNENLVFTINSAQSGKVISLYFYSFDTEQNYDILYIYDGVNTSAPLLWSGSGSDFPGEQISSSGAITIKFISNGTLVKSGWSASWSCINKPFNMCNATVTCDQGILFDSGGPNGAFSLGENYVFTINSPIAGKAIYLYFGGEFDLSYDDATLRIYDGPTTSSPLIWVGSGQYAPCLEPFNSGSVTLKFTSCSGVYCQEHNGFEVNWTMVPKTYSLQNGSVTLADGRLYDSGGGCDHPGDNQNLIFTIKAPNAGNAIVLKFSPLFFDMWSDLYIYDGANISSSLLFHVAPLDSVPPLLIAKSGNMTLNFISGTDISTSFKADWYCIQYPGTLMHNGTITANTGTIYDSGGLDNDYLSNENYTYTINSTNSSQLSLKFLKYETEQGYDSLYIYNGSTISSPLLWSGCGSILPPTVTSNSGKITLHFKSDGSVTKSGWVATWFTPSPPVTCTTSLSEVQVIDKSNLDFTVSPNPFTESATISYTLDNAASVTLEVYNALGEKAAIFVTGKMQPAGSYTYNFKGNVAGIYTVKLRAGNNQWLQRVVELK